MQATRHATPLVATFVAAMLVGCGSEGKSTSDGTIQLGLGTGAMERPIMLPEDARLLATLDEISIHVVPAGSPDELPSGGPAGSWTTIYSGNQVLDLFQPRATYAFLSETPAPPGHVTQARLLLTADPVLETGREATSVKCASCAQTGIKIVPSGTLEVAPNSTLALTLDFSGSVDFDGGHWKMDPVVHLSAQ